MVECSGLENRRGFASSVGSNPTLSAKQKGLPKGSPFFLADRAVSFEPTGSTERRKAPRRTAAKGGGPEGVSRRSRRIIPPSRRAKRAQTSQPPPNPSTTLPKPAHSSCSQVLSTPIHDAKPHGRAHTAVPACLLHFRNLIPKELFHKQKRNHHARYRSYPHRPTRQGRRARR